MKSTISQTLAAGAKKKGICKNGLDQLLKTQYTADFVQLYVDGLEFCLVNDFPSNDFIREHFKGKMEPQGVHLDEVFMTKNDRRVIALGKCNAIVDLNGFSVCELFVKHNSEISLRTYGHAFAMIDVFDDSKLTVRAFESSTVIVNRYGGELTIKEFDSSKVKLNEKQLFTIKNQ